MSILHKAHQKISDSPVPIAIFFGTLASVFLVGDSAAPLAAMIWACSCLFSLFIALPVADIVLKGLLSQGEGDE